MSGAAEAPTLYAFSLGLITAFNPCGFPLLPAYVMVSVAEAREKPMLPRLLGAAWSGLCVTLGFLVIFGALAGLWQAGTSPSYSWLPYVMMVVAVGCVLIGLLYAAGRTLPLKVTRPLLKGRGRSPFLVGFGVTYAVASLGCEFPLFAVALGLTEGGSGNTNSIVRGLAFALGMGLVAIAVALVGAGARPVRMRRMVAIGPALQRVSGAIMILIGAYLFYYWYSDLTGDSSSDGLISRVERISNSISDWLQGSPRTVGVVLAIVVVAVLTLAATQGMKADRERQDPAAPPGQPTGRPPLPPTQPTTD